MKKILAFVVVALIALSPMVLVEAGNNEATDWFCFQKDHQRTGTAFFSEKISTPLTQAWDGIIDTNIYIAQNIDPVKGTIIIGKDIAVAATEKGRIGAFSTLDGKPVWRRDIGLPLTTDMALSDEVLLVPLKPIRPGGTGGVLERDRVGGDWGGGVCGGALDAAL